MKIQKLNKYVYYVLYSTSDLQIMAPSRIEPKKKNFADVTFKKRKRGGSVALENQKLVIV